MDDEGDEVEGLGSEPPGAGDDIGQDVQDCGDRRPPRYMPVTHGIAPMTTPRMVRDPCLGTFAMRRKVDGTGQQGRPRRASRT